MTAFLVEGSLRDVITPLHVSVAVTLLVLTVSKTSKASLLSILTWRSWRHSVFKDGEAKGLVRLSR